ncbi:hypothetical protein DOY81_009822 [Sarcophaga bullata]|nr:hypothetical protein DOY81_009822 [Sarcophaga bullata]
MVYLFLVLIACYGALTYADYFEEDSCPEDNPYFSAVEMTCDMDRKGCFRSNIPNPVRNTFYAITVKRLRAVGCSQCCIDFRQQKCDYAENVKCHVKNAISPRDQCLPNTHDVYPHPSNCNYYYKCSSGFLQVMQCPLHMGWHYEKRACMLRPQVKCYSRNSRQILSK